MKCEKCNKEIWEEIWVASIGARQILIKDNGIATNGRRVSGQFILCNRCFGKLEILSWKAYSKEW